jgi:hypothetical protein
MAPRKKRGIVGGGRRNIREGDEEQSQWGGALSMGRSTGGGEEQSQSDEHNFLFLCITRARPSLPIKRHLTTHNHVILSQCKIRT